MTTNTEARPSRWKRWHKITLGIIGSLLLLSLIGSCIGEDETAAPPAAAPPAETSAPVAPPPAEPTTEAPAETTAPVEEESPCDKLTKAEIKTVNDINEGLESGGTARAVSGYKVELSEDPGFGFEHVAAVKIKGTDDIATFAYGSEVGEGLIFYVNKAGRKYLPWGSAMRPGSPADDTRQSIEDSLEHQEVLECAEQAS